MPSPAQVFNHLIAPQPPPPPPAIDGCTHIHALSPVVEPAPPSTIATPAMVSPRGPGGVVSVYKVPPPHTPAFPRKIETKSDGCRNTR